MIPVLGVPVLNRPDLLAKMLTSVEEPVGRRIVVDNGHCTAWHDVVLPPSNMGVAASWNFIIRTTAEAPWWCLVNADIEFAPGDLGRLAQAMDDATGPLVACLVEFGAFGINRAALSAVGWFDENYHPIYAEDNDYRWRCHLAGVDIVPVQSGASHDSSATIRSGYGEENSRTYPQNIAYHRAKWGGPPHFETFTTPFDAGGDIRDWRLDIDRLRDLAWR